ncbi:VacJ family lipoprotein [Endozoicomonas sp. SM1973]|uniref:VacJ family lipoprotein n=1 Tax=Spartinivicinus marinus TaxID=2994442 RepID=A0A853I1Q6_9GAMM|nr:VacJ family lipoprotein [Spartinivicinus marinus]MCX4029034.1 VacJ family lipoprotein [Spartinivicinus marinus]NYZ65382.1 VacJ family lipoprotein [Spartinivicinus marinus]
MRLAKKWLTLTCCSFFCATPVLADANDDQDPWEGFNRAIFAFNETVDTYALKPITQGYQYVTPDPVEGLVSNFFDNLGEVRNVVNDLLQLEGKQALNDSGRFVVNSTVGMLGLLDVASEFGLEKNYEDFGLTLGHWHVPQGNYLVLPFFGPQTVRSTVGLIPDSQLNPVNHIEDVPTRNGLMLMNVIDTRSGLLKAEDLIVGDKYTFIRNTYLQNRAFLLTSEQPEDDF